MLEKACERAVLLPGPRARKESAVFAGYVGKRRRKNNRFSTLNLVENGSENVIDVPKSLSRIAGYLNCAAQFLSSLSKSLYRVWLTVNGGELRSAGMRYKKAKKIRSLQISLIQSSQIFSSLNKKPRMYSKERFPI